MMRVEDQCGCTFVKAVVSSRDDTPAVLDVRTSEGAYCERGHRACAACLLDKRCRRCGTRVTVAA